MKNINFINFVKSEGLLRDIKTANVFHHPIASLKSVFQSLFLLFKLSCCISSGSALFAKIKTTFKDKHHNLENSTCNPLKYAMDSPILIVSICKDNSG